MGLPLAADRAEISRFYGAMFLRADPGGFVSLRTFEHEPGKPAVEIRAVEINGEGLGPVIAQATGAANRAARYPRPTVFAPPVCTFNTATSGAEANLCNGLCVTFEGDEQPVVAGARLEGVIGPATAVIASGGTWTDPETGEVQDKRHQYWRLRDPTRTAEEHAKLKRCNRLVAALVGGDPSAVPLVHPLGCPGSVHRKAEPRMRRIVELREHIEIDLEDALDRLEQAATLALEHAAGDAAAHLRMALDLWDKARVVTDAREHDPDARDEDLDALADALPNNNAPRAEWIAIGLAFYAGSDGSAAGFNAWDRWARKAVDKYHGGTARQWQRFTKSPPDRTGTGALVNRARRHNSSFRLPSWEQEAEHGEQIADDLLRGEWAQTGNADAADDGDDKSSRADSGKRSERTSNGDTSWPEPDMGIVAPHRAPAPALPLPVFGPRWASWIADAAAAKSAPPDFVAAPLLPAVGGLIALQRRASPWAGWTEPAVLWVADVGNPSSGKSPAIDAVADIIRTLEAELNDDFPDRRRQWKTDKVEADLRRAAWEDDAKTAVKKGFKPPLMPADCEEPEPPNERRLLTNDVTPEKLVRLAAVNPFGLILQRDELAGWLGGMDRYSGSGSERALWLEAFGARPFVLDRVKDAKPIRADALAVCIVGGIQPDRLATLVLAGDDDGLAARILYIWPETGPPCRPERAADDAFAREALRRLARLDPGPDGPVVLALTSAAAIELQQWRVDVAAMEADAAGLFLSWLGKLPGLAVRVALVLEHLWWVGDHPDAAAPTAISEEAVLAAIGFLESYAIPMAKRSFGDAAWAQAERDAAAMGKWILAQRPLPSVVNTRALRQKAVLHTRDTERYAAALAELEAAGWVRPQPSRGGGKGGRQSKDWAVNPGVEARS